MTFIEKIFEYLNNLGLAANLITIILLFINIGLVIKTNIYRVNDKRNCRFEIYNDFNDIPKKWKNYEGGGEEIAANDLVYSNKEDENNNYIFVSPHVHTRIWKVEIFKLSEFPEDEISLRKHYRKIKEYKKLSKPVCINESIGDCLPGIVIQWHDRYGKHRFYSNSNQIVDKFDCRDKFYSDFIPYKIKRFFMSSFEFDNLTIFDKIKIVGLKIILLIRRIRRFIKRTFINFIRSLIFFPCVAIIVSIGIGYGLSQNYIDSIIDGIWEFKSIFILLLLIPFAVNTIVVETKRHANLKQQWFIYNAFANESMDFINEVIKQIYPGNYFYADFDKEYMFESNEKEELSQKEANTNNNDIIVFYIEKYVHTLELLKERIKSQVMIGRINDYYTIEINNIIYNLYHHMFELKKGNHLELYELEGLYSSIFLICTKMRDPWRSWDKDIDDKIKKIMEK